MSDFDKLPKIDEQYPSGTPAQKEENLIKIAGYLKGLTICHACVVEGQQKECSAIQAQWAGREILRTLGRENWETKAIDIPAPVEGMNKVAFDLEEIRKAVFGDVGDEPNVYSDYDYLCELSRKLREAIRFCSQADAPRPAAPVEGLETYEYGFPSLIARVTELSEDRDSWRRVAERLEREKQELLKALEFYADERNYDDTPPYDGDPECFTPKAIPTVRQEDGVNYADCGEIAREARKPFVK